MADYDYIIIGSGAAGCVLAYRLSEDPANRVLLLEAGPKDTHPLIHMPKGIAKVMADPKHTWVFASKPEASTANQTEYWARGRVLGGSTSINGMMYVRGMPADYDAIAELTSDDWSWEHIGAAYKALEDHELGEGETRGKGGPVRITVPTIRDELSEMQIAAGHAMGWPSKDDMNAPDDAVSIGYAPRTVFKGKRQSAVVAFLRPAMKRPNLTVLTNAVCDRVLFEGKRASGVRILHNGRIEDIPAKGEVIVAGGALSSPGILERSGIGDPAILEPLGIEMVHPSPEVGANLIEHRAILVQSRLKRDISHNKYYSGWRLLWNTAKYYLGFESPMGAASYEIVGWFKTDPGMNRPDAQALVAPFSFNMAERTKLETFPGMHVALYPLRPNSRGRIHIESTDPNATARLEPNYRATEQDKAALVGSVRTIRRYMQTEPLASLIAEETSPGMQYQTDEEILAAYDQLAGPGYHAVGSCRMGKDDASVVDPELRVRGVEGLRVMDTSVMPVIPSGNTNGPTMAMAWRAADIILRK